MVVYSIGREGYVMQRDVVSSCGYKEGQGRITALPIVTENNKGLLPA